MPELNPKLETNKFVRKPFYVDAVQVTSDNIGQVARWCSGKIKEAKPDKDVEQGRVPEKYIEVNVYRPMTDRQKMAFVGDWVLFAGKGYKVYTDVAFQKSFELIDGTLHPEVDRVTNRSAVTGEFVSAEEAAANPDTTVTETRQPVETRIEKGTTKRVIGPAADE